MPPTDRPTTGEPHSPLALPSGTRLGDFELRAVLGAGGFGIVYDAYDHALNRRVAIKEFMPALLASRTAAGAVSVVSQSQASTFEYGLRSFVNEARLLAGLDHPSLVKVYQFWKANGTAYFVMPFYEGQTLSDFRRGHSGGVPESMLRNVLESVLGALEVLHGKNIVHRDIAPDNILLTPNGTPILLDFGSARMAIAGKTQQLTAVVKQGYAPMEQYDFSGTEMQGPWTDFYALGGTLRFMLTGVKPQPAQIRALRDELYPLASEGVAGISMPLLRLIDWMLALRPEQRPQSAQQIRAALRGDLAPPVQTVDIETSVRIPAEDPVFAAISADRASERVRTQPLPAASGGQVRPRWGLLAAGLGLLVAAAGVAWLYTQGSRGVPTSAVAAGVTTPQPAVAAAASVPSLALPASAALVPVAAASEAASAAISTLAAPASAPLPTPIVAAASAPPKSAVAEVNKPAASRPKPAPPPAERPAEGAPSVAAESEPKLSPDMAAALERARAARLPGRSGGVGGVGGAAESPSFAEAASNAAQHSSPLAHCRRDYPTVPLRGCLVSVCQVQEHRFHPVCVRLHREMAEQPRSRP